jgi:hypothetical protein
VLKQAEIILYIKRSVPGLRAESSQLCRLLLLSLPGYNIFGQNVLQRNPSMLWDGLDFVQNCVFFTNTPVIMDLLCEHILEHIL